MMVRNRYSLLSFGKTIGHPDFGGGALVDGKRAKEIMEASYMIEVTMAGIPVFLQKVHEDGLTAQIFPLDEPDHEQIVTLNQLVEE